MHALAGFGTGFKDVDTGTDFMNVSDGKAAVAGIAGGRFSNSIDDAGSDRQLVHGHASMDTMVRLAAGGDL